jgi:hypothetical protein
MLNHRLSNICFWYCLLCAGNTFSQAPDTIVVYEYVRVVDTVWVERNNHEIKILQVAGNDKIKCKTASVVDTLHIVCPESATFSEKSILSDENQEQVTMKKKGFLAFFLLPFQMATMGQVNYQLIAGSSNSWVLHQTNTISNPVWSGVHVGAEVNFPFKHSKIEVATGIVAHFLSPPNGYKQTKTIDSSLPYQEYDYARIHTQLILNELNTGLFATGCWQLAIPLKIKYRLGDRFNLFMGMAYRSTEYYFEIPENLSQWRMQSEPVNYFDDFEFLLGSDIRLVKNFWLKMNFSKGLIGKHNFFEDPMYPTLGVKEYYFKSLNFDVSLAWQIPNRNFKNKHLNKIEIGKP